MDIIKKIKSKSIHFFNGLKDFIRNNKIFSIFLITNLINTTLLRCLTARNYFAIKPIVGDFLILLIFGSISYLLKERGRKVYLFLISILFTTIIVINSMYYTFFSSYTSISLISTSFLVIDVKDAVVKNVINPFDFIYVWQPIVLVICFMLIKDKNRDSSYKKIIKKILTTFVVVLGFFLISLSKVEYGRLLNLWNKEYIVMHFGLLTYHVDDLITNIKPKINNMFGFEKAFLSFKTFYDEKEEEKTNEYTKMFEGKNVIVIHYESMQLINMMLSFNDQELTPNLNRIANEGIFFNNFYSQVSVGTSSDAEFTFDTGLLPVSNGTVFISYSDREFVAMPQLLKDKGYYTFSLHGNKRDFWNRNIMHPLLGYDDFFAKESYNIDEEIGLGLSDVSFYRQSVQKIKDIKNNLGDTPYYTKVITLTNHTPFSYNKLFGEYNINGKLTYNENFKNTKTIDVKMENTELGDYFKSVHYADMALGLFFKELEENDLLKDTVVVIYGDHDARINKSEYEKLFNYDSKNDTYYNKKDSKYTDVDAYDYEIFRRVPFIIWSGDKKLNKQVSTVAGMYDVLPTLGNMLGIESKYSLGVDVMELDDNIVVFPDGNFVTNKLYYDSQNEKFKQLNDEEIDMKYLNKNIKYSEELLLMSNNIISFDLIRKESEMSGKNEEVKN